jgi:aminoglycoside/choline kinase family phosphotransferase
MALARDWTPGQFDPDPNDPIQTRDYAGTGRYRLMEHLRNHPLCVLHGDSQGGNLFFTDGVPGYLDWQHSMFGHWAFDLRANPPTPLRLFRPHGMTAL